MAIEKTTRLPKPECRFEPSHSGSQVIHRCPRVGCFRAVRFRRQSREELNFVKRFVKKTYLTGLVYYSGQPFAIAQFITSR